MSHIDPSNPFASPLEQSRPAPETPSEAEVVRRQYLNHEASVQSMGLLFILGGAFGCVLAVIYGGGTFMAITQAEGELLLAGVAIAGVVFLLVGGLSAWQLWTGWKLRQLDGVARLSAIIISAIGLLGFPIGTLIIAYFLYLAASSKGEYVLSKEYAEVRRATPHIRYKTSIVVWILLGLVLFLLGVGCLGAILASMG